MLSVATLVEIEHLGLHVEAGTAGLDRRITMAHVCELSDPRPWLDGGELIMTTGLAIPRGAAAQSAYLERLCDGGASALAVAADMSAPPLTATMRRLADDVHFPVLRVSYEVPFLAISQVVQAASTESFERRLLGSLRIFDSLRRGTTALGSPADVLARLEVVSGYTLALASVEGTLIHGDRALLAIVPQIARDGEHAVVEVSTRDRRRRFAQPLFIAGRPSGLLLAEEREPGSGLGLLALQNVATVAAVQLAAIRSSRDLHLKIAQETFEDLVSGVLSEATVTRRVELAGLDGSGPLVVLALTGIASRADEVDAALRNLYGALCDAGVPTLVRRDDTDLWVAMAHADYRRLAADGSLAALLPHEAHVGVSRPVEGAAGVPRAAGDARWALAESWQRAERFVDAGTALDFDTGAGWLPLDRLLLEELVRRTLGPLVTDERAGMELVRSLEAYLEEGRRIDATCQRLGIHRHTLAYRLQKVEELTGRSLRRMDDVVELWRGVRARAVLKPFSADRR